VGFAAQPGHRGGLVVGGQRGRLAVEGVDLRADRGVLIGDDAVGDLQVDAGGLDRPVPGLGLHRLQRHPRFATGSERFSNHAEYRSSTNEQWRHLSSSLRFFVVTAASCGRRMQQIWVHHRLS
jgi:hypothetical protein